MSILLRNKQSVRKAVCKLHSSPIPATCITSCNFTSTSTTASTTNPITPNPFTGVWPIVATPFKSGADESVDYSSFEKIIDFFGNQLSSVCNGLTIIGVLGESNRLTDSERECLIKIASTTCKTTPICVGTSHSSTYGTIKLTEQAMKYGINYAMITPSKEAVPSDDKVYQYYTNICNYFVKNGYSSDNGGKLGVVLQDHPASTQVHMAYNLMLNIILDNIDVIKCVKLESLPSPPKIRKLRKDLNQDINPVARDITILGGLGALYGGFDLEAGSDGFMTGFAFPEILWVMQNAARKRTGGDGDGDVDMKKMRQVYNKYLPLMVFEQQPGVGVRKEVYKMRGLMQSSHVRHPGVSASGDAVKQLEEWVEYLLPGMDVKKLLDVNKL